ncbi:MAG TPA: OmpH family outer membrane protein [Flavobacteriales bacterium]|jgi:outer membrane protein|nr:OmpH family outer membrane protein [Flavobacteriales bacterium]HOZ40401.1 OmpH family outer membrane protein [Flavobacteriales bacterium]
MKRTFPTLILLAVLLGMVHEARAQRIAFVNTKYILDQMPEYSSAQKELDRLSKQWQEEIDERHLQIKRMRDSYNAEAILLTEEMKRTRQDEIDRREREARDLQKKRFGPNGDLFKKRQELIQPIQDRVYTAVKEVAGTSYVAVFDIGGQSSNLLFASEKYDKSDTVLRKLGIRPGKEGEGEEEDKEFGEPPADGQPAKDSEQRTPSPETKPGGQDMKQPR